MVVDTVTVCSPNHLHDAHIRFALRSGANAVCEKPLVLNPWNLDGLQKLEEETGKKVNAILQLRLHPSVIRLKKKLERFQLGKKYELDLTYITSRGNWYHNSWKGDIDKSGGVGTNIGIHFFDMLLFLFGAAQETKLFLSTGSKMSGYTEFEDARVRWFLSVDKADLPNAVIKEGKTTHRSLDLSRQ